MRRKTPVAQRLKRIACHDFVRHRPSAEWIDGMMLGNGDIGVMVHGAPTARTFTINKSDVWDYRVPDGRGVFLRAPFEKVREMVARGDRKGLMKLYAQIMEEHARFYPGLQPCAVMQLSIASSAQTWEYEERLSMATAEVTTKYRSFGELAHSTPFSTEEFVSAAEPIVAVRVTEGDERPRGHRLTLTRDDNPYLPRPRTHAGKGMVWLVMKFPDGLISLTAATAVGVNADAAALGAVATLHLRSGPPDKQFKKYVSATKGRDVPIKRPKPKQFEVYATTVRGRDEKKLLREAKQNLRRAVRAGFEALRSEHRRWWRKFWSRSYLEIADAKIEARWYLGLYTLACCSREGGQAAGLQGVWGNQNVPPWCADYHADINVQSNYWSAYTSDHLEQAEPYYRLYEHMVPQAEKDTRKYFKMRGFKFPMSGGPDGHELGGYIALMIWPGGTAWLLLHFWWHYLYTMNRRWLSEHAYPLFLGAADFYEDFLLPDGKGGLKIFPSTSPEEGTDKPEALGTNSTCDLALMKAFFRAAIRASEVLNRDADRRETWRGILERLSGYPLISGRYKDLEERDFRFKIGGLPLTFSPVYPAGEIGLGTPTRARRPVRITLRDWDKYSGRKQAAGFGGELMAFVEARLGMSGALSYMRREAVRTLGTDENAEFSGFFGDAAGRRFMQVDALLGFPGPVMECLLQSHDGVIRFFPAVPKSFTGRFEGFRTVGAFRVSAEIVGGDVRWAAVTSLSGGRCVIRNPWRVARVTVRNGKAVKVSSRHITLDTRKGDKIELTPAATKR